MRSLPLNTNEDDYVSLSFKKVFSGLSVIMLLTMGGGLSVFALEMMFNTSGSFGTILFSGVIVGTLLVCIPNGMIVIHGLAFFSKWNVYNCAFQLGVNVTWFIFSGLADWPLHVVSILFPSLCVLALRSTSYKEFVEYYYHLQTNRRNERKALKSAVERLKK
ncbi:MAG: hypothetical protein ACI9LG_003191 [Moritella dasanensis]|jgi:hypothetical protein